ncbi:hypothetical protein TELCIR_07667 [Teladorsagia circumcincta]|uniref:Peptidase A2 domain-containing protein n=1 Tax=Teladorsagia circumcincta TaxID=45464 RepID=A0A2G9UJQ9_TELCI|nr:hypothetical protein TELCIR_07667 [Teladorsagia circumcincta]
MPRKKKDIGTSNKIRMFADKQKAIENDVLLDPTYQYFGRMVDLKQQLNLIDYFGALAVWLTFFSIIFIISNTWIRICCVGKEDESLSASVKFLRCSSTSSLVVAVLNESQEDPRGKIGHHTSICKKAESPPTRTPTATVSSSSRAAPTSKKSSSKRLSIRKTTAKTHSVTSDSNNQDECGSHLVLHVSNTPERSEMPILVGQAQVLNPTTQTLECGQVVLDSGADRSFISDDLADRLHLPEIDKTVLKISAQKAHYESASLIPALKQYPPAHICYKKDRAT